MTSSTSISFHLTDRLFAHVDIVTHYNQFLLTLLLLKSVDRLKACMRDAGIAYKTKPHCLTTRFNLWRKFVSTIPGQYLRISITAIAYFNLVVVAIVSSLLNIKLIPEFKHNIMVKRGCCVVFKRPKLGNSVKNTF